MYGNGLGVGSLQTWGISTLFLWNALQHCDVSDRINWDLNTDQIKKLFEYQILGYLRIILWMQIYYFAKLCIGIIMRNSILVCISVYHAEFYYNSHTPDTNHLNIRNIWIPETFDYQTFWNLDFKWFGIQMVGLYPMSYEHLSDQAFRLHVCIILHPPLHTSNLVKVTNLWT